jgi:hypothetical protein
METDEMIQPTESDIGRKVIYIRDRDTFGDAPEEGVITSFNDHNVFVRYGAKIHSEATAREDLEWVSP